MGCQRKSTVHPSSHHSIHLLHRRQLRHYDDSLSLSPLRVSTTMVAITLLPTFLLSSIITVVASNPISPLQSSLSSSSSSATGSHYLRHPRYLLHHHNQQQVNHDQQQNVTISPTTTTSSTPKPGYFKPLQVIKYDKEAVDLLSQSPQQPEQLPTPEAWKGKHDKNSQKSVTSGSDHAARTAFGLPGYSAPEGFSPRRGATAADYSANAAGFLPSSANVDQTASASSRSRDSVYPPTHTYESSSKPDQLSKRYKERRTVENYNPMTSASNEDSSYSKSGGESGQPSSSSYSSEYGVREQNHPSSAGGSDYQSSGSYQSSPSSRRKPYMDEMSSASEPPQPYGSGQDFHKATHYFHSDVIRDSHHHHHSLHDDSGIPPPSSDSPLDSHVSSDTELAQLAASISDFSSPSSSVGNVVPSASSDVSFSTDSLSSLTDGTGAFGSASGSWSSLSPSGGWLGAGGPSFSASIPSAATVPGVPAGAIVGAPGSAPPPGMKLAGYVTMAAPAAPGSMNMMGGGMMSPSMLRTPMMGPGMSGGPIRPYPFMGPMSFGPAMSPMGPGFMGGPGGMSSMFGPGSFPGLFGSNGNGNGGNAQKATSSSSPSTSTSSGSQTAASQPAPARSRFLSRLNPLNLFRRLRNRATSSTTTKPTTAVDETKALESMIASESNPIPVRKGFSFLKRSGELLPETNLTTSENFPIPSLYYAPLFKFETPIIPRTRMTARGGRRILQEGPRFMDNSFPPPHRHHRFGDLEAKSSSPSQLMGSGNFEVIRGGLLPPGSGTGPDENDSSSEEYGRGGQSSGPAVFGFQGFNHFSSPSNSAASGSIYNTLSSSDSSSADTKVSKVESLPTPSLLTSNSPSVADSKTTSSSSNAITSTSSNTSPLSSSKA